MNNPTEETKTGVALTFLLPWLFGGSVRFNNDSHLVWTQKALDKPATFEPNKEHGLDLSDTEWNALCAKLSDPTTMGALRMLGVYCHRIMFEKKMHFSFDGNYLFPGFLSCEVPPTLNS